MVESDETHLNVNVSFRKSTVFHHFSDVLVVASAKFEQGPKRHPVVKPKVCANFPRILLYLWFYYLARFVLFFR